MEKWEYAIRISQLSNGNHIFDFSIGNSLKEKFESQLMNYIDVKVHLNVSKTSDFLDIRFHFLGKIGLICDRCSVNFDYPINTNRKVIFTFKPISNPEDDEIIFLGNNTDYLDLSQEFYDFICLEIPQRKVPEDCPRLECPKFSYSEEIEEIDPRWAKLLELKNKED